MKKQDLADWFEEFSERVEEKMSKECPWEEDEEQRDWFMDGVQKALDEVAEDIESGRIKTKGQIREYAKQRAKDLDNALIELDDYCGEQVYVELDGKYSAFLAMSGKKLYNFLGEKRCKQEKWKFTGSQSLVLVGEHERQHLNTYKYHLGVMIKLPEFRCKRCGHRWYPRRPEVPRICPRCKSAYWDRERRR